MPPDSTKLPPRGIARRLQAMSPEERREHLIPATQGRLYAGLRRHVERVLSHDPSITDEQTAALCALLRGESE